MLQWIAVVYLFANLELLLLLFIQHQFQLKPTLLGLQGLHLVLPHLERRHFPQFLITLVHCCHIPLGFPGYFFNDVDLLAGALGAKGRNGGKG